MPFVNATSGQFGFGRPNGLVNLNGSLRFSSIPATTNRAINLTGINAIGTGTATVEFWYNADSSTGLQRLLTSSVSTFVEKDFAFRYVNGNFVVGDGVNGITLSVFPSAGVWNHFAWVGVSGTSQSVYLNGTRVGTGGSYDFVDTAFTIGGRNIGEEYCNGNMSNLRYVRGTAVYTGTSFTVPTGPLEAISGTEILFKTINDGGSIIANSGTGPVTITNFVQVAHASSLTPFS
jgi:hypothetical protein